MGRDDPVLVGHWLTIKYRFLLISLNIDPVLEVAITHQRKKRLDKTIQGNGLQNAYSITLAGIKGQRANREPAWTR